MGDLEKMALESTIKGNMAMVEKAGEIGESIGKGVIKGYQAVEKGTVTGYKKIEQGTVGGYKKIEESVVGAYKKVEDAFVGRFLTHDGESVEDAKKRIAEEQADREGAGRNVGEH